MHNLFRKNRIRSIYERLAAESDMYIRTVKNGEVIDFVGYTSSVFKTLQTGVIYPVLPVAASDPNKYCISDHWLPFLVFSEEIRPTRWENQRKES